MLPIEILLSIYWCTIRHLLMYYWVPMRFNPLGHSSVPHIPTRFHQRYYAVLYLLLRVAQLPLGAMRIQGGTQSIPGGVIIYIVHKRSTQTPHQNTQDSHRTYTGSIHIHRSYTACYTYHRLYQELYRFHTVPMRILTRLRFGIGAGYVRIYRESRNP